jgi:HEAT repeat protein
MKASSSNKAWGQSRWGQLVDRHLIDSLIDALTTHHAQKARRRLVRIGKPAVPALLRALADPQAQRRWEAAKALSQIADPSTADALVAALQDDNSGVRWLAAEGLIAIGPDAVEPLLNGLIEHPKSILYREGAHHVLHDLEDDRLREIAAPVLEAMLGVEPSVEVPQAAVQALSELAPGSGIPKQAKQSAEM